MLRIPVGLALGFLSVIPVFPQNSRYANKLAPYVASPQRVVDRMLELAQLKQGETLYDLGSGDGRILITAVQKYGAKAVGVEISSQLVQEATDMIARLGLQNQAKVIHADLMTVDLSPADVVTIYLMTQANEKLRPRLEKFLKPGARVVSHDYPVPGWKPKLVETGDEHKGHMIFVYEMPPQKEGK